MKNKRILFIIPKICNGGAERRTVFIANSLAEKGFNVELLSFWDTDEEYPLSKKIKRIHLWQKLRRNHHAKDKIRILNLFFIFLLRRPKIVITMHPPVALMARIAGFLNRFKLIDLLEVSPNSIVDIKRRCLGWDRANLIVLQCERQKSFMPSKYISKCVVIPNPVPDIFANTNHKYRDKIENFINVGRLDKEKNQELLIKAFRIVLNKHKNVILTIYGRGPLKKDLELLVTTLKMEDSVFFVERSNEMNKAYDSYDSFILSSNFEGMPNSLLEAMAVGLPSISTNCDTGPSDIIKEGNGVLTKINDELELAKAINFYIENPEIAKKYGRKGKETIMKNFNQRTIIDLYINEIKKLL